MCLLLVVNGTEFKLPSYDVLLPEFSKEFEEIITTCGFRFEFSSKKHFGLALHRLYNSENFKVGLWVTDYDPENLPPIAMKRTIIKENRLTLSEDMQLKQIFQYYVAGRNDDMHRAGETPHEDDETIEDSLNTLYNSIINP